VVVRGNTIILATSDVRAETEVARMSHYPFTDLGWRREWDERLSTDRKKK